jgi:hypothetical protein
VSAQGIWRPVEPGYGAGIERVHRELKFAASLHLSALRKWAIEQKIRCEELTPFVQSELRHLRSSVSELVCVTLQI